ncbi:MAG: iron-containing alcohol dehydrogenase [Desulfovibrionaceae bacterium]
MGGPFPSWARLRPARAKGLIVAGSGGVERNGTFDRAVESLKAVEGALAECSGVEPNPRIVSVARCAKRVRRGRGPGGVLAHSNVIWASTARSGPRAALLSCRSSVLGLKSCCN